MYQPCLRVEQIGYKMLRKNRQDGRYSGEKPRGSLREAGMQAGDIGYGSRMRLHKDGLWLQSLVSYGHHGQGGIGTDGNDRCSYWDERSISQHYNRMAFGCKAGTLQNGVLSQ